MIDKQKKYKRQNAWQKTERERLNFIMNKGTKDRIKAAADKLGLKLSEFVRLAIDEKIESVLNEENEQ